MTDMLEEEARIRAPLFKDRKDAGEVLATCLAAYRDKDALVLGIPRGGVPVAVEVARGLNAEMDIIVARKLGSPVSAELAMGAVTANGGRYLNEEVIRELDVSGEYLARVTDEQMAEARRREARFRRSRPPPALRDRIVILVDDGLATGATMRAAVRSVRNAMPARLVVAVPVAPPTTCAELRREADEVVCPHQPAAFWAIGLFYQDFAPTEDSEVESLLQQAYDRQPDGRVVG
jgi:predicted phosphoribosyltransferase